MTRKEVEKAILDLNHDEWYELDKNDTDYEFFVATIKNMIDTSWDQKNKWQLDFNDDYTKIRKQLSHFRGAASILWTTDDFKP